MCPNILFGVFLSDLHGELQNVAENYSRRNHETIQ